MVQLTAAMRQLSYIGSFGGSRSHGKSTTCRIGRNTRPDMEMSESQSGREQAHGIAHSVSVR